MKSKKELLKNQRIKDNEEFQEYVNIMEKAIQKKYSKGLDFDECPHVERFIWYRDVDIDFYTGYEKKFIKAIKQTKSFKKITDELAENGYEYELEGHVRYSNPSPEWTINLIIS